MFTTIPLWWVFLACSDASTPGAAVPTPLPSDLGLGVAVADAGRGVCVSVQLDRWDADHRAAEVAALQQLGVTTIRNDLRWGYSERSPGVWDWTTEDAWVDAAQAGGFEVIAMLGYGNAHYAEGATDEFYPPDDPADFAAFAAEAAARYDLARWEIWNEPNAGYRFWKVGDPPAFGGDPVGYAALFVPAAEAIRAVHADAEIQIGGTFFHEMGIPGGPEFVAEAIAADPQVLALADAVAWHPYTLYPPRVPPEEGEDGEIALWDMDAAMADATGGLPRVITEAGWPAFDGVDEDEQAAWSVREFVLAQALGTRDVCLYTLEDGDDPDNSEHVFGLWRNGLGEMKPVGEALAEAAAMIEGADCNGRAEGALGLPTGVMAVRYTRADAAITAVWSLDDEVEVTLPPSADGCSQEGVTLPVGERPVWVVEPLCG